MATMETNNDTQISSLLVLSTVLTSISVFLMIVRIWIRFFFLKIASLDDYMAIAALIFTIGYLAILHLDKINGLGHMIGTLTYEDRETQLKIALAIELIYYFIITCIKSSIMFMYNRFAISDKFKKICLFTNVFIAVLLVIYIIVVFTQCQPLAKVWDATASARGSCIDVTAYFYFSATINIVLDVWILIIPIPTVKSLRVSKNTRRSLYVIFGVGGFATICSCARLYSIHTFTETTDPFRNGVLVNLWSMVEINISIWCVCAPALRPIFSPRRLLSGRMTSNPNSPENSNSTNSKNNIHGSMSQSHMAPICNDHHSSLPKGSSNNPQDIELGLPQ